MNENDKEYLLHKIVATSGFLFALCILPVAQYILTGSQVSGGTVAGGESGQVAGESTDQSITGTGPECVTKRDQELIDLKRFEDGKKIYLLNTYQKTVQPYQEAIKVLAGDPETVKREADSLNRLIDDEYQTYLRKLSAVSAAVDSQKKLVESRSCLPE